MKLRAKSCALAVLFALLAPHGGRARGGEEEWPPLGYLRNDYRAVQSVAHVRIGRAEIAGRIGGYENWRVSAEVIEPFKGRLRRGQTFEYLHGAEAGLRADYFSGEKIVFLLEERDASTGAPRYTVLENSTLPHTRGRARKLRLIKNSYARRRARRH
jgi:hypothetical protein